MSDSVMIEQLHLGFLVPEKMPECEAEAVRRVLASAAFRAELARAVNAVMASRPEPEKVVLVLAR